jgi:hypothetical protein
MRTEGVSVVGDSLSGYRKERGTVLDPWPFLFVSPNSYLCPHENAYPSFCQLYEEDI